MSAVESVVFCGYAQTILITRRLIPTQGSHIRSAGAGELRAALDTHLAENAGAVVELAAFWADSGGRPISVLLRAQLVAEVSAAVGAGRLHAFVVREPSYASAVEHQALMSKAERAVRADAARRNAAAAASSEGRPAVPLKGPLPADMAIEDKFVEVFHRAMPKVGPQVRRRLAELVEHPENLLFAVGTLVVLAQLHAVAVGETIDAIVLAAIIFCAMARGMSFFSAIAAAVEAVRNFVLFIVTTVGAKDGEGLDAAAEMLAAGLVGVGVDVLTNALGRIAGRFTDSLKKTPGRRTVATVSKEEMAGKGKKAPAGTQPMNEGAARPPLAPKTPPVARVPPERKAVYRDDLDESYFDPKTGELTWPDGKTAGTFPKGFDKNGSFRDVLEPGQVIDRYGSESGRFLSPAGTPYEQRALPYDASRMDYRKYRIMKPLPVESGKAQPYFGQAGGGRQYMTDMAVDDLVADGYLVEIVE